MRISNKIVSKFQEGGAAPAAAPQGAPAPAGAQGDPNAQAGADPVAQLAQMAQQALQTQDCQAAIAVCQGFMSLVQGGGQEGGAPPAEGGAPAPAPEGAPVYKAGGKLVRRVKA